MTTNCPVQIFDESLNVTTITVPMHLLKDWWYECLEFDREQVEEPEGGWPEVTNEDFIDWYYNKRTINDMDSLYDWLTDHEYTPVR